MLKEKLISICSNFPNDYKLREYSGRGMYGRSCLGVEVNDLYKIFHLGAEVGDSAFDYDCVRIDNMGMDYILYFPDMDFSNEDLNEEDDE